MKRLPLLLVAMLGLSGCASMVTPYQAQGLRGGYQDTKLADDRYAVVFNGNGFALEAMAMDFAVMRGAELCQTAGYAYVTVVKSTSTLQRTYSYNQYAGSIPIDSPVAQVEVQCSHEATPNARATADVIAQTRAAWPSRVKPAKES